MFQRQIMLVRMPRGSMVEPERISVWFRTKELGPHACPSTPPTSLGLAVPTRGFVNPAFAVQQE